MLRGSDKRLHAGERLPLEVVNPVPIFPFDARARMAIATTSEWSLGPMMAGVTNGRAWPAANRAIFVPFRVPYPVTVEKMAVGRGLSGSANVDLGIYDVAGNRLGSTGANSVASQAALVANLSAAVALRPGMYYLAMAHDGGATWTGSDTSFTAQFMKLAGCREMESAYTLPATATFETVSSAFLPGIAAYLRPGREVLTRAGLRWPNLNTLTTFHIDGGGLAALSTTTQSLQTATSRVLGQNLAYYFPFVICEAVTARTMLYIVGGTSNGNVDLGIYDDTGNLLVSSGSTAQGSVSTLQEVAIADTLLAQGSYYMAIQLSSATGTAYCTLQVDEFTVCAYPSFTQAVGSFGLPSTATMDVTPAATPLRVAMGINFDGALV